MENVVVALIVGAAGVWAGRHAVAALGKRRAGSGCASGCGSCGEAVAPAPSARPLVALRTSRARPPR